MKESPTRKLMASELPEDVQQHFIQSLAELARMNWGFDSSVSDEETIESEGFKFKLHYAGREDGAMVSLKSLSTPGVGVVVVIDRLFNPIDSSRNRIRLSQSEAQALSDYFSMMIPSQMGYLGVVEEFFSKQNCKGDEVFSLSPERGEEHFFDKEPELPSVEEFPDFRQQNRLLVWLVIAFGAYATTTMEDCRSEKLREVLMNIPAVEQ